MRLTFAMGLNPFQVRLINEVTPKNLLISFAYKSLLPQTHYKPEYLILDSGAFTAWNSGKQVDIAAYGDWAISGSDKGEKVVAVNLDVIPGEVGRTSTKQERVEGMRQSLKNANYLREQGLDVMEVFHQDEPMTFLDDLVDRLPIGGILGISPRNDVNVSQKVVWQNAVFRHLYQKHGVAAFPRCHGLAVTSMQMMKAFPYYSVDSSTWASAMRYGTYTDEWGKSQKMRKLVGAQPSMLEMRQAVYTGVRNSIIELENIGDSMTTLWTSRGFGWKD